MRETQIRWHRAVAGGTEFSFVRDHKIVRFNRGRHTFYLVTKTHHGMPVGPCETFDYLDDVLSWIGA